MLTVTAVVKFLLALIWDGSYLFGDSGENSMKLLNKTPSLELCALIKLDYNFTCVFYRKNNFMVQN